MRHPAASSIGHVPPGVIFGAAFVALTLLSVGPLQPVDVEVNRPWQQSLPDVSGAVQLVVRLGQRAVCLPLLVVVAAYVAHRARSWYPLVLSLTSVLVLNLAVGLTKLATARDKPRKGDPDFFEQGIIYPSGHSANAVLVYGLAAYLAYRFAADRPGLARALLALTVAVSLAMLAGSLYLRTHWLTDLVAGWLVGAAVLASAVHERGLVRRFTDLVLRVSSGLR